MSKSIVYEVRCPRCETSFAPETRRCVHCGAPLERGRQMVSTGGRLPAAAPVAEDQLPDEDELLARGPRTAIWVVVAMVTALASMLRTCVE